MSTTRVSGKSSCVWVYMCGVCVWELGVCVVCVCGGVCVLVGIMCVDVRVCVSWWELCVVCVCGGGVDVRGCV